MASDIRLTSINMEGEKTELFMVKIKNPKVSRGFSVTVEMFVNRSKWSPLRADNIWKSTSALDIRLNTVLQRKDN